MNKLYRILGKRGRITIPYEIRRRAGFQYNDVLSFTEQDDRTITVLNPASLLKQATALPKKARTFGTITPRPTTKPSPPMI